MITPLTFAGDDVALIEAMRAGHSGAAACLYDRYARQVRAILLSTLGPDEEVADLLQDVFIAALGRLDSLRNAEKVGSWLSAIAVFVARGHIRMRRRRRRLRLFSPEHTQSWEVEQPSSDVRRALSEAYQILDRMEVDVRITFLLRYVHGMSLLDAAEACGISLSTFKRRLSRATDGFLHAARTSPRLLQFLQDGTRWNQESQT